MEVEKDQVSSDNYIDNSSNLVKLCRIIGPQLFIFIMFIVYMIVGTYIYMSIEPSMKEEGFWKIFVFVFTTLATIGYGNIAPITICGKIFTIFYTFIGIPLCLLTLANIGKLNMKCYWMVLICLGMMLEKIPRGVAKLPILPLSVLFFLTFIYGSYIVYDPNNWDVVNNIYFQMISFSTIGFGDMVPHFNGYIHSIAVVLFLMWGCILSAMIVATISEKIEKIHNLGDLVIRNDKYLVQFGDKHIKISELIDILSDEFKVPRRRVHSMIKSMDEWASRAKFSEENLTNL
ncbi:Two pore domain potassium channel family and Two pore domain potassium channel domain-containing protein [Strongyloides ratti]|uniref:Two pore domain potassium channel family and Two pore domain potassium channel domain-containing protein n=1 Tax=Strongyloides ratti TaxID=34506 RepID=A0A090MQB4_STRRB|nr:Two pore domain potassium channel family and Two pore domain potassium channel domain-containing protein [Strongyloides ratti]CEF60353.1 Two pore domain potassium channel family and Two pore domain potassium channel domain-containing protein [Strongyloides ratti]